MQQIWTDDELRAHWVLSDAELALLRGVSDHRRLTVCVYLKSYQFHARFPGKQDGVPRQVLEFLASQIGSAIETGAGVTDVPDRTARFYKRQIGTFLAIKRFSQTARNRFVDWLVQSALPQAPNEVTLDAAITDWFLYHRMIRPGGKDLANLVARAGRQFERRLFARIASRLSDTRRAALDALIRTTDGHSEFADVSRGSGAASVETVFGAWVWTDPFPRMCIRTSWNGIVCASARKMPGMSGGIRMRRAMRCSAAILFPAHPN